MAEEPETPVVTDETENPEKAIAEEELEGTAATAHGVKLPGFLGTFLKLSGYKKSDILAWNEDRRTVVTTNGSKYQVSRDKKQLKILTGAVPPSATPATEE